ncbi:MAG: DUF3795 domain-containing protein [Candidatus Bathyarchaeota archaeon]|jgi:hypothetical protein
MQESRFTPDLIAPCGMNCVICKAYLAYSRGIPKEKGKIIHCPGCLPRNKNCVIKRGCKKLAKKEIKFCFECESMPCDNLDRLDRRYQKHYDMSMVENLKELKEKGMKRFLKNQKRKYECPECGDVVSVHDKKCYSCTREQVL